MTIDPFPLPRPKPPTPEGEGGKVFYLSGVTRRGVVYDRQPVAAPDCVTALVRFCSGQGGWRRGPAIHADAAGLVLVWSNNVCPICGGSGRVLDAPRSNSGDVARCVQCNAGTR